MPIFAKGVPKDKLTILFFTRAADLDITREQLYRAMVENDCMLISKPPWRKWRRMVFWLRFRERLAKAIG